MHMSLNVEGKVMKQTLKVTALVLAFLLAFGGVSALADTGKTVINVGTNPEFAPFEFVGDDGQDTGIDMDIINAVFAAIDPNIQVNMVNMSFDGLIPALTSGKIDVVIAAMTITDERKQSVLFSDPYFDATQKLIVKDGSPITGLADLVGKKIGVQMGTTGDFFVSDPTNVSSADIQRFDKALDAVVQLADGKLDAVMLDQAPAEMYSTQVGGVTVLPDKFSNEQYGIAFKLDQQDMVDKVNAALKTLIDDGTLQQIIDKYQSQTANATAS